MNDSIKTQSTSFDRVAELYDTYRPSYPKALIDDAVSISGLPPSGKILEVGSGTGIATALFAPRGYTILCIEPGKNLAAVAAKKLQAYPVTIENVAFEDWAETANAFDLMISAQAFHWIDKETGYPKVARALKKDGYAALFWNTSTHPDREIDRDLERVYAEDVPNLAKDPGSWEGLLKQRESEIIGSGCFADVQVRTYPWTARYNVEHYLGLLNTYSDHLGLAEEIRAKLMHDIARVIEKHGGVVDKPYVAVLYMAKKA
jgi:SAM-dependent methyltransferase